MGWFDNAEDDEKEIIPSTTAPIEEETKPDIASLLAQFEETRKNNDADVKSASKKADAKNYGLNVISGISGAMDGFNRSGKGGHNQSFYDGLKKENSGKVAEVKAAGAGKLDDLFTKDKIQRTDVERGQADFKFKDANDRNAAERGQKDSEFKYKQSQQDPKAPKAVSARAIVAKQNKIDPDVMKNMGYEEILDFAKTSQQAAAKGFQLTTTTDAQGRTVHAWADPNTLTIIPTDQEKGFALSVDQTTGNVLSKSDPNRPAQTVMTDTGDTLRNQRTGLQGDRAESSKIGSETGKSVVEAAKAGARTDAFKDKAQSWNKMYSDAYVTNAAGPGAGRVAEFKVKYGFDSDAIGDKMEAEIKSYTNNYIKEISGATVPDAEYEKRFRPLMPTRTDSPALFATKMKAFDQSLKNYAAEKSKEAGALRSLRGAPAPASPPPPSDTVNIKAPDGTIKSVKKSAAQKYLDLGGVIVP